MGFEFWYTLVLFIALTIVLIKELLKPEIAIFSVLILLLVGGVITVKEAFSGFSNIGMLTIAMLFVVAGAVQSTGILDNLNRFIFGKKETSYLRKYLRLLFSVAGISAFLNNTPIVAILIPSVKKWAEKNNYSASKFLIPISYAAILGGLCTLIGTSTNLIVHGLLIDHGYEGLAFFELAKVGIPLTIIVVLFIILFGHRLLPKRSEPIMELGENIREFEIELRVTDEFEHLNKTIEEAGLRHLKGLYLFQIEREGETIAPARPNEKIRLNDRLFFTGLPKTILELQKRKGLQLTKDTSFSLKDYDSDMIRSYEAVISTSSDLVGKNVRESNFRERFNAVIIAIHRNGERIQEKIGDIVLKSGDTLLLLSDRAFKRKWYNSKEFHLISESNDLQSKPKWKARLSVVTFIGMILLAALDILPLAAAVGAAVMILVLTKTISRENAVNSIDWRVLLIIASSFGIAAAVENSKVSDFIAGLFVDVLHSFGSVAVLAGIYLLTVFYTNFITNNTAAVLMFPIAFSAASELGMGILPFAIAIAVGASSSFATPLGYQTNLMVYGPGGYKFKDYLKIGLPLQIIVAVLSIILINYFYF